MTGFNEPWGIDERSGLLIDNNGKTVIGSPEIQRRICACINACAGIPTERLEVEKYINSASYAMRATAEQQRDDLKATVIELLEILQKWEPDDATGEERHAILRAMYQVGLLVDPTKIAGSGEGGS